MSDSTSGTEALDPRRLRRGLLVAVAIGMTVGLVVVVLTGGREVVLAIRGLAPAYLAASLVLSIASWFGQGVSWGALTPAGVWRNLFRWTRAFLGGDFPALVTPFGSGGLPGGVFALTREGLTAGEASAIVATHTLLTSVFFLLVGLVAAIVLPVRNADSAAAAWAGFAAIVVAAALIGWVALRPFAAVGLLVRLLSGRAVVRVLGEARCERWIAAAEEEATLFAGVVRSLLRERPVAIAVAFCGLVFSRLCLLVTLPVIMYGLGYRGDVLPLLAVGVGAMVIQIASPTPGGSGTVEAGMTALLATVAPASMAAASAILWRGITYYSELFVAWLAFSRYLAVSGRARDARTGGSGAGAG